MYIRANSNNSVFPFKYKGEILLGTRKIDVKLKNEGSRRAYMHKARNDLLRHKHTFGTDTVLTKQWSDSFTRCRKKPFLTASPRRSAKLSPPLVSVFVG